MSLEELQDQEAIILIGLFQEDLGSNPDLIAERRAFVELFRQIVQDELTERQRLAVVAVLLQGRSLAVIAGQEASGDLPSLAELYADLASGSEMENETQDPPPLDIRQLNSSNMVPERFNTSE